MVLPKYVIYKTRNIFILKIVRAHTQKSHMQEKLGWALRKTRILKNTRQLQDSAKIGNIMLRRENLPMQLW